MKQRRWKLNTLQERLKLAVLNQDIESVCDLLESGAYPDMEHPEGNLIALAEKMGNQEILRQLVCVKEGIEQKMREDISCTPHFCWYCEDGVFVPSFPFECTSKEAQNELGHDSRCPEEYTCPFFRPSRMVRMDQRQMWMRAGRTDAD